MSNLPYEPGLKVYGYVRVSTDDQAERGVSLKDQPVKIRAFATASGLELLDIIVDAGECSKTLDRPGLKHVLEQLRSGKARGLIVAKLDRLTRHVGDVVHLVEHYFTDPEGCHLISASEALETRSAAGRMFIYMMTVFSQGVREGIVENTAGAMAGKRRRKERAGNLRFGLTTDPTDGRRSKTGRPVALVTCLEDLAVESQIRELRAEGRTLRAIADELNARGLPGKRGITKKSTGRWSKSSVAEILRRPETTYLDTPDGDGEEESAENRHDRSAPDS